jgi:hypothetical protein
MSTKKSDIVLLNLSNYVRPPVVENRYNEWVLNGHKNSFYQYTIDRYNGSPTNAAIINSFSNLIYGKGLTATNANTPQGIKDWVKFKTILSKKDTRRIISDYYLFGEFSAQVIQTNGKDLSSIKHIAKNLVVPSVANEDDEIESYWFSRDWTNTNQNKPEEFPAFSGKHKLEIYRGMPYKAGKLYFADPAYLAGMQYADMEEEIANLNINSIKNGLSAGYIINVPNGNSYTDEEREEFEKQIKAKLTGSPNASRFVISFNGVEEEISVTPFPVNEQIHKQWTFLTEEARQQLLTAHMVVSPMLFGIKDNTGLGNNADELDTAEEQLLKRVIKPLQDFITDSLEEILREYEINLDLEFIPLTVPKPVLEKTELSTQCSHNDNNIDAALELYALDSPEGYELTDGTEYDLQLAATSNSKQDTKLWKVRYAYSIGTSRTPKGSSRHFCNRMMSLSDSGKVFREEDIKAMQDKGVNSQFGHNKKPYSIWLYAGGVNCYHRWERRIFKKQTQENGELYGGNPMQNVKPVNVNEAKRQGFKPEKNSPDVAIAEITKPNHGSLK